MAPGNAVKVVDWKNRSLEMNWFSTAKVLSSKTHVIDLEGKGHPYIHEAGIGG